MALLSTTLIIFFGMVVSVGHLIQARMNLQNSVDFAALVGASYQARYLNAISILNYRLRQNYKFTLADLYVTQSRFNVGFQQLVINGGNGQISEGRRYDVFGVCQQYPGYRATAAVEGAYGGNMRDFPQTDMCRFVGANVGIPHIQWTPVASPNPIVQALNALQARIAQEVKDICTEAAGQNKAYTNYILDKLQEHNTPIQRIQDQLIDDFANAFSTTPELGGTPPETAMRATFLDNLISANKGGPGAEPVLEYLNPPRTRAAHRSAEYFQRPETYIRIRYVDFRNVGTQCRPFNEISNREYSLGVTRSRVGRFNTPVRVPLMIALRASVRPNLLFWPRGLTPKLVAVSAAKPFGSRIGPSKDLQNLELTGSDTVVSGQSNPYANIMFFPGDQPEGSGAGRRIHGFGHIPILKGLYRAIGAGNNSTGDPSGRPGFANCAGAQASFMCMATSPTLWEGLMWGIFPDPPDVFARGPSEEASYPIDFSSYLGMGGVEYNFVERGARGPATAWHTVNTRPPNLGLNQQYRQGGKPKFYADPTSLASAFNPEVFPPESVNQFLSSPPPESLSGRSGYQIKLISLNSACKDIEDSGDTSLDALAAYCDPSAKVFY